MVRMLLFDPMTVPLLETHPFTLHRTYSESALSRTIAHNRRTPSNRAALLSVLENGGEDTDLAMTNILLFMAGCDLEEPDTPTSARRLKTNVATMANTLKFLQAHIPSINISSQEYVLWNTYSGSGWTGNPGNGTVLVAPYNTEQSKIDFSEYVTYLREVLHELHQKHNAYRLRIDFSVADMGTEFDLLIDRGNTQEVSIRSIANGFENTTAQQVERLYKKFQRQNRRPTSL